MFYGACAECDTLSSLRPDESFDMYCPECWDVHNTIQQYRCFTICAVYTARGECVSVGTSEELCAERSALFRLPCHRMAEPKILVVARIRRSQKQKWSFGCSKPCEACVQAMRLYNVLRVAYSSGEKDGFAWENIRLIEPELRTRSTVVVRM